LFYDFYILNLPKQSSAIYSIEIISSLQFTYCKKHIRKNAKNCWLQYGIFFSEIAYFSPLVGLERTNEYLYSAGELKITNYTYRSITAKKAWESIFKTSGLWPRVRARALRADVFLGSLTCQTGALRAPPRPPSQLRCSPKNKK
jgi:hypothetical protein